MAPPTTHTTVGTPSSCPPTSISTLTGSGTAQPRTPDGASVAVIRYRPGSDRSQDVTSPVPAPIGSTETDIAERPADGIRSLRVSPGARSASDSSGAARPAVKNAGPSSVASTARPSRVTVVSTVAVTASDTPHAADVPFDTTSSSATGPPPATLCVPRSSSFSALSSAAASPMPPAALRAASRPS